MNFRLLTTILAFFALTATGCGTRTVTSGHWDVFVNQDNSVTILKNGQAIFDNLGASYKYGDTLIKVSSYSQYKIRARKDNHAQGDVTIVYIIYTKEGLPELTRHFWLYPEEDYVVTNIELYAKGGLSSNYMVPVELPNYKVGKQHDCRSLFIPFDNDKWIRYTSQPLDFEKMTSYEVTAAFENDSRKGLILGSIDHSMWKSAVDTRSLGNGRVSMKLYAGVADENTRDSKPHGTVTGTKIASPRVLLGTFDDWRSGLETYADVNAMVAPVRKWGKSVPFGWNSWGVLQFDMTTEKAQEVSNYIRTSLQKNSFVNPDNTVVVWLDSGWNRFSEEKLKDFVSLCQNNDQQAGIYWTPFTDWGKNPTQQIEHAKSYTYADAYIYAHGEPQELDGAYAIDPTHPAVEIQIKYYSEFFRKLGFTHVKMDFMTHGAMEADKWYREDIKTGIQAYNYGMALIDKYFSDMYINLSISPIFPACYANSRRIACDAWNKIKDSEYTLNALSYGWWQDRIYTYNDADHIVLKDATEGENRARVTSSIITGIYICGDDYSLDGDTEGKQRSEKYLCNPLINAVATGEAFRPVEGNGVNSENQFVSHREGKSYYALFNYQDKPVTITVNPTRLGLNPTKEYTFRELWRNELTSVSENTVFEVPSKDVLLIEIKILN